MPLGSPLGDREFVGDVAVRQTISDQTQNPQLDLAERFDRLLRRSCRIGCGADRFGAVRALWKSFKEGVDKLWSHMSPLWEDRGSGRAFIQENTAISFGRGQTERLFQTVQGRRRVVEGLVGERLQEANDDETAVTALSLSESFKLPEQIVRRLRPPLREQQAGKSQVFLLRTVASRRRQIIQRERRRDCVPLPQLEIRRHSADQPNTPLVFRPRGQLARGGQSLPHRFDFPARVVQLRERLLPDERDRKSVV